MIDVKVIEDAAGILIMAEVMVLTSGCLASWLRGESPRWDAARRAHLFIAKATLVALLSTLLVALL